jgi:ADP-heptose:LPS heptosyltransferase
LVFRAVSVAADMREGIDWRRQRIIVAEPVPQEVFGYCDGIVPALDPSSSMSVVDQVNARPSIVHRASTCSFPGEIKNVAVIRADQLGDMVVSVPALQRLRQLLPNARITGLLSRANEGLARSLKIFDDIIILDFPDDPHQRQRIMSRESQEKLMQQLAPYKFDLAMDFPVQGVSVKLLHLTGAPVRMGYGGDGWKTIDLNLSTHDPITNNDVMCHSARTRLLSEALAAWLDSGAQVVRRDDLSRNTLSQYGVDSDRDFVVLHSGARIKFTQWPYYTELATEIVDTLGLQVVFMADADPQQRLKAKLPPPALEEGRIIYIDHVLPFDHFDTFLSFCTVFVGNDSGPKHLAALRGAKVVSLHSSRIGWSEWGQEQTGVVISRQVPCAGCSLHHDPEECGQGVACITKISVAEVFREVKALAATAKVAP